MLQRGLILLCAQGIRPPQCQSLRLCPTLIFLEIKISNSLGLRIINSYETP